MPLRSLAFSGAASQTLGRAPGTAPAPGALSLCEALRRWAVRVLSFVVGFVVVATLMALTGHAADSHRAVTGAGEPRAGHQRHQVAHLVSRHGCWRGQAPDRSVVPGHAVVTLPGKQPRRVRARIGFAIWLHDKRGTVHAFCP